MGAGKAMAIEYASTLAEVKKKLFPALSMEDALKERASILENIISQLFRASSRPSESLVERICIHQFLATAPHRITSPKSIKAQTSKVFDKYAPQLNVVENSKSGTRCPLTQDAIRVPWVSECGHCFEEASVLEFIKVDKYCPIIGCNKKLARKRK